MVEHGIVQIECYVPLFVRIFEEDGHEAQAEHCRAGADVKGQIEAKRGDAASNGRKRESGRPVRGAKKGRALLEQREIAVGSPARRPTSRW